MHASHSTVAYFSIKIMTLMIGHATWQHVNYEVTLVLVWSLNLAQKRNGKNNSLSNNAQLFSSCLMAFEASIALRLHGFLRIMAKADHIAFGSIWRWAVFAKIKTISISCSKNGLQNHLILDNFILLPSRQIRLHYLPYLPPLPIIAYPSLDCHAHTPPHLLPRHVIFMFIKGFLRNICLFASCIWTPFWFGFIAC